MNCHQISYWIVAGAVLFFAPLATHANVAEIRIQDTSGFTRGVAELSEEEGVVEFNVVDSSGMPAENVEVTLTDAEGNVMTSTAVGGVVVFNGVAGGTWTVASTAAGLTFTSVSISGVGAAAAVGAGAAAAGGAAAAAGGGAAIGSTALAVGGVAAVGGATAAVASNIDDNDSNDDDTPLSPST